MEHDSTDVGSYSNTTDNMNDTIFNMNIKDTPVKVIIAGNHQLFR